MDQVDALIGGAFMDGITSTQWNIGAADWVVLDRTGFHVHRGADRRDMPWGFGVLATRLMRHTELWMANGSERHFIELFSWRSRRVGAHVQRDLLWNVFEIVGMDVREPLSEPLLSELDTAYPLGEVPRGVPDRVRLWVNASDEVEWLVDGQPARHGILEPAQP